MRWCNPWGWKRSSKASILWRFWWREMGFLYQSQLVCEKMEEVLSSLPCLEWQKGPHLLHVCAIAMFHSGFFRHFASEQQPNWLSPDKYLVHRGMLGDFCSCVSGDAWSFVLSWPAGLPDLLGQGVRRPVRWGQETWGHSGHYSLPVSFWGTGCVVLWVPRIYSRQCFQSLSRGSVCCWTIVTSKFCSWTCLDICIIHIYIYIIVLQLYTVFPKEQSWPSCPCTTHDQTLLVTLNHASWACYLLVPPLLGFEPARLYLQRLWTVFELTTFIALKPEGRIVVQPVILGPVAGYFVIIQALRIPELFLVPVSWQSLRVIDLASAIGVIAIISVDLLSIFFGAVLLRKWGRIRSRMAQQIECFSFEHAECHIEADRIEILGAIKALARKEGLVPADAPTWLCTKSFELLVQTTVPKRVSGASRHDSSTELKQLRTHIIDIVDIMAHSLLNSIIPLIQSSRGTRAAWLHDKTLKGAFRVTGIPCEVACLMALPSMALVLDVSAVRLRNLQDGGVLDVVVEILQDACPHGLRK